MTNISAPLTKHLYANNKNKEEKGLTALDTSFWERVRKEEIEFVDISRNSFESIAFPSKPMPHVRVLELSYNQATIEELKIDVAIFPNLRCLYLCDSKVEKLIVKGYWEHLEDISLDGNPIVNIEEEVKNGGIKSLKEYWRKLSASVGIVNNTVKLLLVGNSAAGKSTLLDYLRSVSKGEVYEQKKNDSTHWLVSEQLKLETTDKKKIEINVFDFGGQDYYHDTHHLFFSDKAAYIVVWDKVSNKVGKSPLRKEDEFELYHYPLEYWLSAISYYTLGKEDTTKLDSIKALVVQTKIDFDGAIHSFGQENLSSDYPFIHDYSHISLKERGKRLDMLKLQLVDMLEHLGMLNKIVPEGDDIVRKAIQKEQDRFYESKSIEEFRQYYNEQVESKPKLKLEDEKQALLAAEYFSNLGLLLYYPSNAALKDRVFINQNKITEDIAKVLKSVKGKEGIFTIEEIQNTLVIEVAEAEILIKLMQEFKIIFEYTAHKGSGVLIAPMYLPEDPLNAVELFLDKFQTPLARYVYPAFIHKSIILEFFQEYGKDSLFENMGQKPVYYFWRNGIVLKAPHDNDTSKTELVIVRFFIGSDTQKANVQIYCEKKHLVKNYLDQLFKKLEEINKGWGVEKQVTADGKLFIPLNYLLQMEREQRWLFISPYNNDLLQLTDYKEHLQNKMPMKKIFISYSKHDDAHKENLLKHLEPLKRTGKIATWNDRNLRAGEEWDNRIREELNSADIMFFLLSPDFFGTGYIWDVEITKALERYTDPNDKCELFLIYLRPCDLGSSPFSKYNGAFKFEKAITELPNYDTAWMEYINALKKVLNESTTTTT